MNFADERCIRPSPSLNGAVSVRPNPLNVFSRIALAEHYDFERVDLNELHLSLPGLWCDHDLSLTWNMGTEQIQLFLLFEGRTISGIIRSHWFTETPCRFVAEPS